MLKLFPSNFTPARRAGGSTVFFPNSPCPSPTPIFQQLYLALSHWDRLLAESPDLLKEHSALDVNVNGLQRSNSFNHSIDSDKIVTKSPINRRSSYPANLTVDRNMSKQTAIKIMILNDVDDDDDDDNS